MKRCFLIYSRTNFFVCFLKSNKFFLWNFNLFFFFYFEIKNRYLITLEMGIEFEFEICVMIFGNRKIYVYIK